MIIKYLDVFDLIRKADTFTELKMIKSALYDESETVMLSNRNVHEALKMVNEKIQSLDKDKVIQEILDLLL